MKLWQKSAVALLVATLLHGGQLRMWTNDRNRFLEHWQRLDALALITAIALTAAALLALRELSARHGTLRRLADHAFVLALGGGAIATFLTYADYKSEAFFLLLAALLTWSWCRPARIIPQRVARAALLFSPFALIAAAQLLIHPEWSATRAQGVALPPPRAAHPVCIFVFDEWSYTRSTEDGELLPLFQNLRAFAAHSCVFHDALSPGPRTDESLPRLIFQRNDELIIGRDQTFWKKEDRLVPTRSAPSLFSLARERGYQSALRGFYLPYARMLGAEADSVVSHLEHPKSAGFAGRVAAALTANPRFWHDPLSRRLRLAMAPKTRATLSEYWRDLNQTLHAETLAAITQSPSNSLSFIHYPLPHGPWIFNADASYAGPYSGERMSHDPDGYRRHLGALDTVIGEFLDALRKAGKFDDALIILTSDHSWRADHTVDGRLRDTADLRRVPLFLKLPGQQTAERLDTKFALTDLQPIIDAVMRGQLDEARAALKAQAGSAR